MPPVLPWAYIFRYDVLVYLWSAFPRSSGVSYFRVGCPNVAVALRVLLGAVVDRASPVVSISSAKGRIQGIVVPNRYHRR